MLGTRRAQAQPRPGQAQSCEGAGGIWNAACTQALTTSRAHSRALSTSTAASRWSEVRTSACAC
eukprot:9166595-Alexandrium_andersonii.AAC.1